MRPRKLSLSAFGPFAKTVSIDFTRFDDGSLLLIHGPTGAGKTTLLDAMCVALYGQTSGGERTPKEMRCDQADDDTPTEVCLELAVKGRDYLVRRCFKARPSVELAVKRRGEREYSTVATKTADVDRMLREVVGLDAQQFRQVVMLPQGRFRDFLAASSREREAVLETLFDTSRYAALEEALRQAAGGVRDDVQRWQQRQSDVLDDAGVCDLAGLAAEREEAVAALAKATGALTEARRAAERARRLEEQRAAARELALLEEENGGFDEKRRRAEAARRVESAALALDRAQELERARAVLVEKAEQARATARGLEEQLARSREKRREEEERLARERPALEATLARARSLDEALVHEARARRALGEIEEKARLFAERRRRALDDENAAVARLEGELEESERRADALERSWIDGAAAHLAGALKGGEACPVCGSCDHPSPARGEGDVVDRHRVARAREDARAARKATGEARARREALAARTGGDEGRALALAEVARAEAVVAERSFGLESKACAAELEARLRSLDESAERSRAAAARTDRELAAARATAALLDEQERALDDDLAHRRAALAGALCEAGVVDASALEEARLGREEIDSLERAAQEHEARLRAARARYQGLGGELDGGDDGPAADGARATALVEDLIRAEQTLKGEVAIFDGFLEELAHVEGRLERARHRYTVVGRLAEVALGEHPARVTFQRWVLGALLDGVLELASARLVKMTKGRYTVHRVRGHAARKRTQGLELAVLDAHSGRERPVSTLSGGESFLVALALALGLADVVQARAGGVELDSLFVDEGFGGLDAESMDLALDALAELKASGRMVGIISHVAELKHRVDARIEISGPALRGNG